MTARAFLPLRGAMVWRPIYGYRPIAALLNQEL